MLVNSKEVLLKARQGGYAVPSANFIDIITARTYVNYAEKEGLPLILSYAQAHGDFLTLEMAAAIGKDLAGRSSCPVVLHLDHGADKDFILRAMDLGFTSVMIDASMESLEDNIAKSREIVDLAHKRGITVESELGHVGSNEISEYKELTESTYTEVSDVIRFVEETGVDSLAISIGTSHGLYKGTPHINFDRLKEIAAATDIPLVLHGGSSSGDENLSECARNGIAKINIYTDFIVAATAALKAGGFNDYAGVQACIGRAVEDVLARYYKVFHTAKA